jgi:predicted transcriptional regulator
MEMECNSITRLVLPAIRINIAEQLEHRYGMRQREIAARLGIAQVAVSKYLSGNYSKALKELTEKVRKSGIVDGAVIKAAGTEDEKEVNALISDLCYRFAAHD